MANEITYSINLGLDNVDLVDVFVSSSQRVDQSSALMTKNVQNIGTTPEAITIGADIVAAGYASFINLEDAGGNSVDIGYYDSGGPTFYPFFRVQPTEQHLFRLAIGSGILYAQGIGGPVELFYIIYDD